ncbi:MAG: DUF2303 family protein [Gallionella sp.]|nr:MAG: DUF2303 family protein [Gallionella sp.]
MNHPIQSDIQRIEQLVAAAADRLPATNIPFAVLPEGSKIHPLEHLLSAPSRLRRDFSTRRIPDFLEYVNQEFRDTESAVFISTTGKTAMAIIDAGSGTDPLWGDHRAILTLEDAPAYQALTELVEKGDLNQRDLIEYLEDWADCVTASKEGSPMTTAKAITGIRKVEINAGAKSMHEEGDFSAKRTRLEEVEIRGAEDMMPDTLVLTSAIYIGTTEQSLHVKIVRGSFGDKPTFRLRIQRLDKNLEAVATEMEARLKDKLTSKRIFIGTAQTRT